MKRHPGGFHALCNAFKPCWLKLTGLWLLSGIACADLPVHHDLRVVLEPDTGHLQVTDHIRLPHGTPRHLIFTLGEAFKLKQPGSEIHSLDAQPRAMFRRYAADLDQKADALRLSYEGHIGKQARQGEQGMPLAVLDEHGAFLDGAIGWYPRLGLGPVTFRLTAELPSGWSLVSQGRRLRGEVNPGWEAQTPQDDIYLLAGPYQGYVRRHMDLDLEVYLLRADPPTAKRYLAVMGDYIDFYGALIGDYPYPKFAVVENRWQTGYGMPSFTLLGSQVLRLPFILYSSLPHEILHDWWGNGVFVDPEEGNWSEGLTAYLADYLIEEANGAGQAFRRRALEKYASFAAQGRDSPLSEFRSRHDDASQAVGYSKSLMLFHMTRRELGDADFIAGLRAFWDSYRFRHAGFSQLKAALEATTGRPLRSLNDLWLDQPGAPALALDEAKTTETEAGRFALDVRLRQTQSGPAYPMNVPLTVQLAGEPKSLRRTITMDRRLASYKESFNARPLRVDVDAGFDLFRLLAPEERPPSLSRLFGANRQLLVFPAKASDQQLIAWRGLAKAWQNRYRNVTLVADVQLDTLPNDQAVWLLGWDNLWLGREVQRFSAVGQTLSPKGLRLDGRNFAADDNLVVILEPANRRDGLAFVGAGTGEAIAALARKLPHYGRYGRLVFDRATLANRVKDELPAYGSPLARVFGDVDPGPPALQAPALSTRVPVSLPRASNNRR